MTQVNHGLRNLLARARNYDLLQSLVGAEIARRTLVREYIEPEPGMRVLDIGCGTGGILAHLPRVEYVGFDLNARYIAEAIARYGSQGRFLCADVNAAPQESEGSFDRILAIALLHHLDDGEAVALMALARRLLSHWHPDHTRLLLSRGPIGVGAFPHRPRPRPQYPDRAGLCRSCTNRLLIRRGRGPRGPAPDSVHPRDPALPGVVG